MIKCLSQKTQKMSNKRICTNYQHCVNNTTCPHSKIHNPDWTSCSNECSLIKGAHKCVPIFFLRKQKLEKLNQKYEV